MYYEQIYDVEIIKGIRELALTVKKKKKPLNINEKKKKNYPLKW